MNDSNFTDRLLDASLQEYSRVAPPADFASRVLSREAERRLIDRRVSTGWRTPTLAWPRWLWIPAAAAVAMVCGLVMMRPSLPAPPAMVVFREIPAVAKIRVFAAGAVPRKYQAASIVAAEPPFHTLTGMELASLTLSADLLPKQEEKPVADIVIDPLIIAPLSIPEAIPTSEGEKQP
jgi:hypothetical protein